jgi:hypothetical protein
MDSAEERRQQQKQKKQKQKQQQQGEAEEWQRLSTHERQAHENACSCLMCCKSLYNNSGSV